MASKTLSSVSYGGGDSEANLDFEEAVIFNPFFLYIMIGRFRTFTRIIGEHSQKLAFCDASYTAPYATPSKVVCHKKSFSIKG